MNAPRDPVDLASLARERDLYLRLLQLGHRQEMLPFMADALALVVEVVGAAQGYLELYSDDAEQTPTWWMAHGFAGDTSTSSSAPSGWCGRGTRRGEWARR
jgi:hypothetical protein